MKTTKKQMLVNINKWKGCDIMNSIKKCMLLFLVLMLGLAVALHSNTPLYSDSFQDKDPVKEEPVLQNARLSLTDGMMDVRVPRDSFRIADAFPFRTMTGLPLITVSPSFTRI